MKKELKDYLPFHIGCSMFVLPSDTIGSGWLKEKLVILPKLQYSYPLSMDNFSNSLNGGYIPILRKYSSMTDAECLEWANLYFTAPVTADRLTIDRYPDYPIIQVCDARVFLRENTPEIFKWLLSKHFDVFGLIKEGLAIDEAVLLNNI